MQFARHFYAIGGILVVLSAASLGAGGKVASKPIPMPVNVTNPTSNPVNTKAVGTTQVSGSVTVANTGPISVQQDLTNLVPVGLTVDVHYDEGVVSSANTIYTVPAGKMLVLQAETMSATMDETSYVLEARLYREGTSADMPIPISNAFGPNETATSGAFDGTYYVPENTKIGATALRANGDGDALFHFGISGYLVPMPASS